MITKQTRDVYITQDGTEFDCQDSALRYEIKCALSSAEGVFLQSYQIEPVIISLLKNFTITPLNHETKELS